jgi:long-chain acyl-CoA synthetase
MGMIVRGVDCWPSELTQDVITEIHHGSDCPAYRQRPTSLAAMLERAVQRFPDRDVLVVGRDRFTYLQFRTMVCSLARALRDRYGIGPGDRVAVLMVNGLPLAVSLFAISWLGAVAVLLNTKTRSLELEWFLSDSGARLLLLNPDWWPNVEPVISRTAVRHVVVTRDPGIPAKLDRPIQVPGAAVWEDLATEGAPDSWLPPYPCREHDIAIMIYTSGTTGKPKGCTISHWNLAHAVMSYERTLGVTSEDRTAIAVPMFHVTGLIAQFLLMVHVGGSSVVLPVFDEAELLGVMEREKVTFFHAAPTVYIKLLRYPSRTRYELPEWRTAAAGGAATPQEVIRELRQWLPHLSFHTVYGLTETSSPATVMPVMQPSDQERKAGSCGLPLPCVEVKVVSGDQELGPDEPGELLIRGATVAEGYWNNPEATQSTFKDGWLRTGDVARIDADGFVYIMDRVKDMINRGGEKVYSIEVEDVLHAHPEIVEAAVVGVPDPVYGEAVRAFVVKSPGSGLTAEAVQAWVRERLAGFKVPSSVEFLDILPRNPNGKVMKHILRSMSSTPD